MKVYSYWVENGVEYLIDEYDNFEVDLSNAEPQTQLELTHFEINTASPGEPGPASNAVNGEISWLTIVYKQDRGYTENRVFYLEMTKDPIDYILEGFSPQSTHPPNNGAKEVADKITYTPVYGAYLRKGPS